MVDDRWVNDKPDATDVSRWKLLTTNDRSSIEELSYIGLLTLRFLERDYVVLDSARSIKQGTKVGIGGDSSRVVSANSEAVSMSRCSRVVFVQSP